MTAKPALMIANEHSAIMRAGYLIYTDICSAFSSAIVWYAFKSVYKSLV